MQPDQLQALIRKYNDGTIGPRERALLDAWYLELSRNEQVEINETDMRRRLDAVWNELKEHRHVSSGNRQDRGPSLQARRGSTQPWVRYAAAAAIGLSVLCGGGYLYHRQVEKSEKLISTAEIAPGGNRAALTLPNGKTILLDQAGDGQLVDEGGVRVIKMETGLLAYQESAAAGEISYHTLSTPRGGQYQVVLPDGTRVWLNASSTLRYPSRFSGEQRRVSLSGEGYFEVATEKTPFVVTTAAMEATVLGTHFNMKAYRQEVVKTTLLEGSLLITAGMGSLIDGGDPAGASGNTGKDARSEQLLRPGQEAVLKSAGQITVREADPQMAIAWKNGLFKFRNDSLTTIMRQLARWYDVEVVYDGAVPDKVFTGEIYRNLNASQVLEVLSYTGIHFSIQGRKIIVKE